MTVVSVVGEGCAHVQHVTEERRSESLNETAKVANLQVWKGEHSKQSML